MLKNFLPKTVNDSRGFSLLEVLMGVTVFMIGMLGVTALNISSLKSNTFSGNLSEATQLAAAKIEELMVLDFDVSDELKDDDGDGINGDLNDDGTDDDDPADSGATPNNPDGVLNFGLDDTGTDADHEDLLQGKNDMFTVYWNVAEGEPLSAKTKTVNVIVEWQMKEATRRINIETIILKTD